MKECVPAGIQIVDIGSGDTMLLINGRYKRGILYWLSEYKVVRYNELKRSIGTISHKTCSLTLKQREADGLILRKEYPQIPPKVEYSLSLRGQSLIPMLDAMCEWGEQNKCNCPADADSSPLSMEKMGEEDRKMGLIG